MRPLVPFWLEAWRPASIARIAASPADTPRRFAASDSLRSPSGGKQSRRRHSPAASGGAAQGGAAGAAFQGVVFGFLRADNPHLQIEIGSVRTRSKRLQRVGDVDAWEGGRLAVSAEVKQYEISLGGVGGLEAFANETGRRGALGLVVALGFEQGVRERLAGLGVQALDRGDLLRAVALWDPLKQRTAVVAFVYYVTHVEKNSALGSRLGGFLDAAASGWDVSRGGGG